MTKPEIVMGNPLSKYLQTTFLRVSPSPGLSHHHSVGYLLFTNSFYLKLIIHNLNVNRGTWSISFDKISALANLKRTLNYLTNLAFWGKRHPSPSLPTMTLGLCSPICAQILWKKIHDGTPRNKQLYLRHYFPHHLVILSNIWFTNAS